jgi:hypothetical protein
MDNQKPEMTIKNPARAKKFTSFDWRNSGTGKGGTKVALFAVASSALKLLGASVE